MNKKELVKKFFHEKYFEALRLYKNNDIKSIKNKKLSSHLCLIKYAELYKDIPDKYEEVFNNEKLLLREPDLTIENNLRNFLKIQPFFSKNKHNLFYKIVIYMPFRSLHTIRYFCNFFYGINEIKNNYVFSHNAIELLSKVKYQFYKYDFTKEKEDLYYFYYPQSYIKKIMNLSYDCHVYFKINHTTNHIQLWTMLIFKIIDSKNKFDENLNFAVNIKSYSKKTKKWDKRSRNFNVINDIDLDTMTNHNKPIQNVSLDFERLVDSAINSFIYIKNPTEDIIKSMNDLNYPESKYSYTYDYSNEEFFNVDIKHVRAYAEKEWSVRKHWRNQRYGKGRKLVKRIEIKPQTRERQLYKDSKHGRESH